jgi:hypothetical protein
MPFSYSLHLDDSSSYHPSSSSSQYNVSPSQFHHHFHSAAAAAGGDNDAWPIASHFAHSESLGGEDQQSSSQSDSLSHQHHANIATGQAEEGDLSELGLSEQQLQQIQQYEAEQQQRMAQAQP